MDISQITDEKELKAMAYDQIGILEQTKTNLQLINDRLSQVQRDNAENQSQQDKKED